MKTSRNLKLLLVLLSLGVVAPIAQAGPKNKPEASSAEASLPKAPIASAAELKAVVPTLSDAQYTQAVQIFSEQDAAIKAMGEISDLPALSKLQADTAAKISAMLTPEQTAVLDSHNAPPAPPVKKKKKKNAAPAASEAPATQ